MPKPSYYYLALSVDVARASVGLYFQPYDEDHNAIGECITRDWPSFCFTWEDLANLVAEWWAAAGGDLNPPVASRPSPFLDLT